MAAITAVASKNNKTFRISQIPFITTLIAKHGPSVRMLINAVLYDIVPAVSNFHEFAAAYLNRLGAQFSSTHALVEPPRRVIG